MFSYLSKVLFSGFLKFKGNFFDGQNNSKYCDVAPFKSSIAVADAVAAAVKLTISSTSWTICPQMLFFVY